MDLRAAEAGYRIGGNPGRDRQDAFDVAAIDRLHVRAVAQVVAPRHAGSDPSLDPDVGTELLADTKQGHGGGDLRDAVFVVEAFTRAGAHIHASVSWTRAIAIVVSRRHCGCG